MRTFKVGDPLPEEGFGIKKGWVHGLGLCERCHKTYDVRVIVKNGRITGEWEHM